MPKRRPIASCSELRIAKLRPMMQAMAPMKATMPQPREMSRPRYAPSAATRHVIVAAPVPRSSYAGRGMRRLRHPADTPTVESISTETA